LSFAVPTTSMPEKSAIDDTYELWETSSSGPLTLVQALPS